MTDHLPPPVLPHPIGVFDSGLGGLTVLSALQQRLPGEHFLYFADTRYLPYGERSESFLRERGLTIARHLENQGAKALVIACNTATAAAAEAIRAHSSIPVVALEPAVKPAVALSSSGRIGVMATSRTLQSQRFHRLVASYAEHATVLPQPCPGLAHAIETHGPDSLEVATLLDTLVEPLRQAEVDVVVLGCTHYPWVSQAIAERLPDGVQIVDTGEAVARQLEKCLTTRAQAHAAGHGQIHLQTSGAALQVRDTVARLWGAPLPVSHVDL